MASPAPEAAAPADPKPLDAAPTKDPKPETNGRASPGEPAPEPKAEPEKPVINGDGRLEEHASTNGVAQEDVTMGNSDDAEPTESAPTKPDESSTPSGTDSKPAEMTEAPAPVDAPEPESQNDVEMTDSKPVEETPQPAQDKEGGSQPVEAPSTEVPNDVAQEDVKENTTEPAAESTEKEPVREPAEKSPEAPAQADEAASPAPDSVLPTSEVDLQPASLSQFTIESTETDTLPVEASVEVSMTDAFAKVAREREDDATEEPASKRAKTEPEEDEPSADATALAPADAPVVAPVTEPPAAPATTASLGLHELPKWNDPGFSAKVIQPFQRRGLRNSMSRVKKTKNGGHFKDSVQKLWPALWDKYSASIEKPMDLGEIDRSLRDGAYTTFGDFKADLLLIAENSLAYNGLDHYMTIAAKAAISSVWDDVMAIPDEEPVKQKSAPKHHRAREPRSINVKPESVADGAPAGQAGSSAGGAAAPKAAPVASDSRRASTTTEGDRPKRTVRAPKPKDIDYTTKPSRKKLKPDLQFCDEVLSELMRDKYHHLNKWFNDPVDAEGLGIPHYYSIITQPMDFGKIQKMLHEGDITSWRDFDKNVRLVFSNCYKFNGEPEQGNVSYLAKQLEDIYSAQAKGKDAWLAKHAKANPPPTSASAGSDDDDEEDEGDDGEDAGPDPSREVKDLEARLREEMDKQTNLFAAEQPNQSMIQIQQGIVNMVQQALLQAKQKLNEYKQKNGGAGAKAKKPKSKSKPPSGGRKSGAAPPKKAPGGGGQKKKKNLTAADKDNIANAINDLEYPHLDKAIEIIKMDTGQMESEDGELELDIDQLSHEALLKLWELCKKVLPGFGKDSAAAPTPSPEVNRGAPAKQAKTAAKPKKNKPMSAQEQEARIAQLRQISDLYKPGQEPADEAQMAQEAVAMNDSSDDSSEEE